MVNEENMENIEEEKVQEDSNAIKNLRERVKELEVVEKEYKSVKMDSAIKDAGFDPESGQGKALKDLYKGELKADAIQQFAQEQYGWTSESPTEPGPEDAQKARVVSSQQNLDAMIDDSIPVEPVALDDQIAQAQADGDWVTSSNLKTEQLKKQLNIN